MFSYIQIFLCITSLYSVTSKPLLGEFSFKKNFDVVFKPPPIPPLKLGFLKEFWSPLGKFGIKHAIEKRDTGDLDGITAIQLEKDIGGPPVLPVNRYEVIEPKIEPPLEPTPLPHLIKRVTPVTGPEINLVGTQIPYIGRFPAFVTPVPAPPNPPVVITPIPPKKNGIGSQSIPDSGIGQAISGRPPTGLLTDIGRDELINEYLKYVERENVVPLAPHITENHIVPVEKPVPVPPKPVEPKPAEEPVNPLVRGSRLALYFGNILLDVLTQFMGGLPKQGSGGQGFGFF